MTPKLLTTLTTLTSEEWSSFRKYLLMNTGEESDNYELFDFLRKRKEKLTDMGDTEKWRKKHFARWTAKGLSNAMSRLQQWLEEWLVMEQMRSIPYEEELLLLKTYNSRGLYEYADQVAKGILRQLEKADPPHAKDSEVRAALWRCQYYSDNPIKYREGAKIFEEMLRNTLQSYKENGLLLGAELINWSKIIQVDMSAQGQQLNAILELMPESYYTQIFEKIRQLQMQEDLHNFMLLWDDLKNKRIEVHSEVHDVVVFYLISKVFRLWGNGELTDPDVPIALFTYGLTSGTLLQAGKIPVIRFHNIISYFGLLKDYDRSQKFIEEWTPLVATKSIESTKALAMAQNAFYHERYGEIIPLIRVIDFDTFVQKGRAQCLILIALYKEGEDNYYTLQNNVANFKRSLKRYRGKVSDNYYESLYNLTEVIGKLAAKKYEGKDIDLSTYKILLYRNWVKRELGGIE